jgi:hypothetical protein
LNDLCDIGGHEYKTNVVIISLPLSMMKDPNLLKKKLVDATGNIMGVIRALMEALLMRH